MYNYLGQISYNKLSSSSKISKTHEKFAGSSSYIVDLANNIIYKKKYLQDYNPVKFELDVYRSQLNYIEKFEKIINDINNLDIKTSDIRDKHFITKKRSEERKLNKKKLIARAVAFSQTRQAKKFLAFYSISFPCNMSEDDIYKAFNKWLTNCRRYYNLKNYIWVAEKQKNNTVHFHLLTCDYMKIRDVNRSMAITLDNQNAFSNLPTEYYNMSKKKYVKGVQNKDNYNGCDVVRVNGDKSKVIMYMTKYMSKDKTIKSKRSLWYCSRSVSALFTVERLNAKEYYEVKKEIDKNVMPIIIQNEYCNTYIFNVKQEYVNNETGEIIERYYHLPNKFYEKLKFINQKIFDNEQTES